MISRPFFRRPVKNERQLCACQFVDVAISSSVAPWFRLRSRSTLSALVWRGRGGDIFCDATEEFRMVVLLTDNLIVVPPRKASGDFLAEALAATSTAAPTPTLCLKVKSSRMTAMRPLAVVQRPSGGARKLPSTAGGNCHRLQQLFKTLAHRRMMFRLIAFVRFDPPLRKASVQPASLSTIRDRLYPFEVSSQSIPR